MNTRIFSTLLISLLVSISSIEAKQLTKEQKSAIKSHWTKERITQAIPRDFVVDRRGLSYIRASKDKLLPHGHFIAAEKRDITLNRKPGDTSGGDSTPPTISNMTPSAGSTIGSSQTFSATVTDDASAIKSVVFIITYPSGLSQSYNPAQTGTDTWSLTLNGFTDGNWSWQVTAKDTGDKGGNTATSPDTSFTVDTNGGGNTGEGDYPVITDSPWSGGKIQTAAGRLYFEMLYDRNDGNGPVYTGFVCSGTVVDDTNTNQSTVLTAAHCVYDDVYKEFARYSMFIPNQADTTGSRTDGDCSNDPLGCWVMDYGVVDVDWTTKTFPDNIPYDYAFYVSINDTNTYGTLDSEAGSLPIAFAQPVIDSLPDSYTHALGYSYKDDPDFMYCAENMTKKTSSSGRGRNRIIFENWWLSQCGLEGGSSGGPWVQPMDLDFGTGPIISVNSWGYTGQPGMAGPRLDNSSAGCVFEKANTVSPTQTELDNKGHIVENCSP